VLLEPDFRGRVKVAPPGDQLLVESFRLGSEVRSA
jgi:hypothetical protein